MTAACANADMQRAAANAGTLVDTHAHCYDRFDRERFVRSALANVRSAGCARGALILAEADDREDPLWAWRNGPNAGATEEFESLIVREPATERGDIVLISGRQIVSQEGLEVLALCTSARIVPGAAAELIERIDDAGGIAALPWGFGKWWGRRGRKVLELCREAGRGRVPRFLLGDSGCRARTALDHPAFSAAEHFGIPVVAGSDPLPLPAHETRAASFGVVMTGELDGARPAAQIAAFLRDLRGSPRSAGRRQGVPAFIVSQISLRTARRERTV